MAKDRIEQLRAGNSNNANIKRPKSIQAEENNEDEENEMTALTGQENKAVIVKSKSKGSNELEKAYKHVNIINEYVTKLQEDIVQLKRYHIRMQQSTRTDSGIRDQIESLNEDIKTSAMKIKTNLKDLDNEKQGDDDKVINRVVKTQHSLLTKRFLETMEDYENCLATHKKICEDLIKKQLHIVLEWIQLKKMTCVPAEKEVTDEELTTMLDAEDVAIFVDNYTRETIEARQSLEDARDRHKEILLIEKDIALIRQLFFDMALHVTQQGELIDRIEYHIGNGYVQTQKGHKNLSKAEKFRRKVRKKKCWLIVCLSSVVGVLLLVIVIQLSLPS